MDKYGLVVLEIKNFKVYNGVSAPSDGYLVPADGTTDQMRLCRAKSNKMAPKRQRHYFHLGVFWRN